MNVMRDLREFLTEITDEKWERINDAYFVCGERVARIDVNHKQVTLTINNRPIFVGPLPDDDDNQI